MRILTGIQLLSAIAAVSSCPDGDSHVHAHRHERRAGSSSVTPPTRPLEWGDVNIIHTTDSHGWLLGHQEPSAPEPNYSADFGDFASFVTRMKEIALKRDVDLLLVDSGDLHDGTGLSDGYPPGAVDGHDSNEAFTRLPYDVLTIGNHELYQYDVALDMYQNFAPRYPGRYLTSNVNITVADSSGNPVSIPLGSRFAKFKTRKGRKVTSLGVIFEFKANAKNTTVQKVEDMVKEAWFKEAIVDAPDFFLLLGHMGIVGDKWPVVFDAVRAVHPTVPILILGGHTHIRDCVQLDKRSMALESGRFMETVGWLSAKLDSRNSTSDIGFSRRYLDANRVTYEYHTNRTEKELTTTVGGSITQQLQALAEKFKLSTLYGTAPHDFTLFSSTYPSEDNVLSLFIEKALPFALAVNNTRASIPNIILSGAGAVRYDIFAGPFNQNDQLTAAPYNDVFLYTPNVIAGVAKQVLPALQKPRNAKRSSAEIEELHARGYVGDHYETWLRRMNTADAKVLRAAANLTLGYVTKDACPGVGDDTIHAPIPYFEPPHNIGSPSPKVTDDTPIDLVIEDYLVPQVIAALNQIQKQRVYTQTDFQPYSPILVNQVFGVYAQAAWN